MWILKMYPENVPFCAKQISQKLTYPYGDQVQFRTYVFRYHKTGWSGDKKINHFAVYPSIHELWKILQSDYSYQVRFGVFFEGM